MHIPCKKYYFVRCLLFSDVIHSVDWSLVTDVLLPMVCPETSITEVKIYAA